MKKILVLFLFTCISLFVNAQTINYGNGKATYVVSNPTANLTAGIPLYSIIYCETSVDTIVISNKTYLSNFYMNTLPLEKGTSLYKYRLHLIPINLYESN